MSFDLRLVAGPDADRDGAARWLDEQATEREGNWFFEDPATGVAWWVDPGEDGALFDLGLNLSRPLFFALQVMPWTAGFASRFGLLVEDPQADAEPRQPDADALIESWRASNELGARALVDSGTPVHWMPREAATAWWRYMRSKEELEAGSEEFVPTLVLLGRPAGGVVERLFTWTDGIPVVWPPADVVVLGRSRRKLLRKDFEMRLAPAEEVRERLASAGLLDGDRLPLDRADDAEEHFAAAFEAAREWDPQEHEQLSVHAITDADTAKPA